MPPGATTSVAAVTMRRVVDVGEIDGAGENVAAVIGRLAVVGLDREGRRKLAAVVDEPDRPAASSALVKVAVLYHCPPTRTWNWPWVTLQTLNVKLLSSGSLMPILAGPNTTVSPSDTVRVALLITGAAFAGVITGGTALWTVTMTGIIVVPTLPVSVMTNCWLRSCPVGKGVEVGFLLAKIPLDIAVCVEMRVKVGLDWTGNGWRR